MISDLLGTTGIIATILSVIFALAALYNSRQRQNHLRQMEKESKTEEPMRFRPPPSSPIATVHPGNSSLRQTGSDRSPANSPSPSNKPVLFRQIRPTGEVEMEMDMDEEDLYVWE